MSAKKQKIRQVVVSVTIVAGILSAPVFAEAGVDALAAFPGPERVVALPSGESSSRESLEAGFLLPGDEGFEARIGEIDPGRSHAWGENVGWADFRPDEAGLKVGANILAGWIRVGNLGWVHLGNGRPENGRSYSNRHGRDYGVNNDGEGNLSGWGWSETAGWISFEEVEIDARGNFSGRAVSWNVGPISFSSAGRDTCLVKTDPYPWREIGAGQELRAGSGGIPGGGEKIAASCGGSRFAVPSSGSVIFAPLRLQADITPARVQRFEAIAAKLFSAALELSSPKRGPPRNETTESTSVQHRFHFSVFYSNPALVYAG